MKHKTTIVITLLVIAVLLVSFLYRYKQNKRREELDRYGFDMNNSINAVFSSIQLRTQGTSYNIDSLKRYVYSENDEDAVKFEKLVQLQDSIRKKLIPLRAQSVKAQQ